MKKIISIMCSVILTVYMFGNSAYAEITGDINADGRFNPADILGLQQWLTTQKYDIDDWQADDIVNDGVLNVFDLYLMIINNAETPPLTQMAVKCISLTHGIARQRSGIIIWHTTVTFFPLILKLTEKIIITAMLSLLVSLKKDCVLQSFFF